MGCRCRSRSRCVKSCCRSRQAAQRGGGEGGAQPRSAERGWRRRRAAKERREAVEKAAQPRSAERGWTRHAPKRVQGQFRSLPQFANLVVTARSDPAARAAGRPFAKLFATCTALPICEAMSSSFKSSETAVADLVDAMDHPLTVPTAIVLPHVASLKAGSHLIGDVILGRFLGSGETKHFREFSVSWSTKSSCPTSSACSLCRCPSARL